MLVSRILASAFILTAALAGASRAQQAPPLAELEVLGAGTPGSTGVPRLVPLGRPAVGEPGMGLRIEGGLPGAVALIIVGPGVASVPLPQFGARLFPALPALRIAVGPLDAAGDSSPLPSGPGATSAALTGLEFAAQGMVLDPGAQGGAAFTAGLRLRCGAGYAGAGLFAGMGYRLHPMELTQLDDVFAVGDFDGNERLDLVAVIDPDTPAALRILRQLDDGTLAPPVQIALPKGVITDLLPIDLDADGRLDLIVAQGLTQQPKKLVHLFYGLGDGGFAVPVDLETAEGLGPCSVAVADLTGDGALDLAVAGWDDAAIGVLPSLAPPALLLPLPAHSVPGTLRAADFDADGVCDLAVLVGYPQHTFAWLRGLGGGAFAPAALTSTGGGVVQELAVADMDADGDLDVVVGHEETKPIPWVPTIVVLDNAGSGSFTPTLTSATGGDVSDVELADVDEDGDVDVLVAHRPSIFGPVAGALLLNLGGSLAPPQPLASLTGIAAADLDADGHIDLAGVAQLNLDPPSAYWIAGHGDGSFDGWPALIPEFFGTSARAADLDTDGDSDLVARIEDPLTGDATLGVLLGSSTGLGAPTLFDPGGGITFLDGIDLGDLDLDGTLDAVVAGVSLRVLPGDGAGGFGTPFVVLQGSPMRVPRIADLNADGRPDLVVTRGNQGLSALLALPGGGYAAPVVTAPNPATSLERFEVGDLDDDGWIDAVAQGVGGFHVFKGLGNGGFAASFVVEPDSGQSQSLPLLLADLDRDGDLDLARQRFFQGIRLYLNDGTGGRIPGEQIASSTSIRLVAADLNLDGALDLLGNELSLGFGDGHFADPLPAFGVDATGDFDGDGDIDAYSHGSVFLNRLK